MKQKLYPPRFRFEVSERCSYGSYFNDRRFLNYEIKGGQVGDVEKVMDDISVPKYTGMLCKERFMKKLFCFIIMYIEYVSVTKISNSI